MNIALEKFGNTLVFRDRGKEAFSALEPNLKDVPATENVIVDFSNVLTFSPSWGDEFLSPLFVKYGNNLKLANTSNSSVLATLDILKQTKGFEFNLTN